MPIQAAIMPARRGDPVWGIATLYPEQGQWSEREYLDLSTNHLVEFTDGLVEFLPMPDMPHQLIVHYLFRLLDAFVMKRGLGSVFMAPTHVRIRPGKIREPDLFFIATEQIGRIDKDCCNAVDLVIEVTSSSDPDGRSRDLVEKRSDYADAGIPEYWIIAPRDRKIIVLTLQSGRYVQHTEVGEHGTAQSARLAGLEVQAEAVWAAASPAGLVGRGRAE